MTRTGGYSGGPRGFLPGFYPAVAAKKRAILRHDAVQCAHYVSVQLHPLSATISRL
jgi:hypothetical protein